MKTYVKTLVYKLPAAEVRMDSATGNYTLKIFKTASNGEILTLTEGKEYKSLEDVTQAMQWFDGWQDERAEDYLLYK